MKMEGLFNENPVQKNDGKKVGKGEVGALSVRGAGLAQHIRGGPPSGFAAGYGHGQWGGGSRPHGKISHTACTKLIIGASKAK